MATNPGSSTHMSLIGLMFSNPADCATGNAFLERYRGTILSVIHSHGLRGPDAEDVLQETFQRLWTGFDGFRRERRGGFRAWLRTLAFSATMRWYQKNPRMDAQTAEALARNIQKNLIESYDLELADIAIKRVRLEVNPRTWEMFERTRLNREPAKEVAASLGVSVLTVYSASQRTGRRLAEVFSQLDGDVAE